MTLSDATTPGQNGPGAMAMKGYRVSPSSSITGNLPLDCLVSYPWHSGEA